MMTDQNGTPARQSDMSATMPRILVVEDDVPLANFLRRSLEAQSYDVTVAHDGEAACEELNSFHYQLLVLDLNLPKLDGFSLLKQIRPTRPDMRVLVLTARSALEDRVQSLDNGADDCLLKPFSLSELSARVRALLRRSSQTHGGVLRVGELTLDCDEWRVERANRRIELTSKEFSVLELLMRNARRVVTRAMIMEQVWNTTFDSSTNLVDVYVKYVRDKVDADFPKKMIRTIRGVGYMLQDEQG
jgi:DNA-binding response OmpR family regulator